MNIDLNKSENTLVVAVTGSIDTLTAGEFEQTVNDNYAGISNIILDFANVEYVSSAGLRVIMTIDKHIDSIDGNLTLKNINSDVLEVFEMTGFDELLNIE